MASQIAGQLAQWHLQGTKGIKIEQVIINTVRIDMLLVKLKVRHGKGIDTRVITNEIRSPRLNDVPQLTVEVLTKQGRQRCVFIENGFC